MGMWNIFQCANVLGRPLKMAFPLRGSDAFRQDFNCTIYTLQVAQRSKEPLTLMWTPMHVGGEVNHFVPPLKVWK